MTDRDTPETEFLSASKSMIYLVSGTALLFMMKLLYQWYRKKAVDLGLKTVPEVSGNYFYVGHGLSFNKDIMGFVRQCYEKYGKIFKIKIFRFSMVVICDRGYAAEFFKSREHTMSLYDNLGRLGFIDAFFPVPEDIKYFTEIIKNSVGNKFDIFLPKIRDQAILLTQSLKEMVQNGHEELDMVKEFGHFMASTSAWCIAGIHLNQDELNDLHKFSQIVNKVMISSYFFPRWVLSILYGKRLGRLKCKIGDIVIPEIKKYRQDLSLEDSPFLRVAVDKEKDDGSFMSDQDIRDLFVCLLYTSSENTALALSNAIIDLALHPNLYEKLREEIIPLVKVGDFPAILQNQILNACLIESVRLNPQIFTIGRTPKTSIVLGEYYVGNVDSVILCGPLLQVYGSASDVFQNPEAYDPFRFIIRNDEKKERQGPPAINAWGGGIHHCPGKTFALYEIKTVFALFIANFYLDIQNPKDVKIDFFAPKAFSEKKLKCRLKLSTDNTKSM